MKATAKANRKIQMNVKTTFGRRQKPRATVDNGQGPPKFPKKKKEHCYPDAIVVNQESAALSVGVFLTMRAE